MSGILGGRDKTGDKAPRVVEDSSQIPSKRLSVASRRHTLKLGAIEVDLDIPEDIVEDKDLHLLEDDQFLQAKGDDVKIWFPVRRIHNHTCQCCSIMCGMWILSLILLALLSVALGAITFDIEVPFYDRAEINQGREDAYLATQRDADYVANFFTAVDATSECVHEDPTVLTRNGTLVQGPAPSSNCQRASNQELKILYVSSDRKSNILTRENLEEIRRIELEFLSHMDLPKYCHLIETNVTAIESRDVDDIIAEFEDSVNATEFNAVACSRINSVLNFMDELYFNPDNGLGLYETLDQRIKIWRQEQFGRSTNLLQSITKRLAFRQPKITEASSYPDRVLSAFHLASALKYLHQRQLIHRDLKPENIGFDVRGDIKIFDFGLSREMTSTLAANTQDGEETYKLTGFCGSPRYMAPEVALKQPYNEKSDVYAFTILFWEMLSLRVPYASHRSYDTMFEEVWREPYMRPDMERLHKLPTSLANMMEQAWHHDYQTRPSMLEIQNILKEECLSFKDVTLESLGHRRRRSRVIYDKEHAIFRLNTTEFEGKLREYRM